MASNELIPETPTLVSISQFSSVFPCLFVFSAPPLFLHFSGLSSIYPVFLLVFSLRVSSVFDHFGYPAPPLGEWRHAKWYNLRLVQETLEGMQHRVSNGMTPLPDLQVLVPSPRTAPPATQRSPPIRGTLAAGSSSRPEIAMKSPRTAAGKAQMVSAAQKRGSGEGLERGSAWRIPKHPRRVNVGARQNPLLKSVPFPSTSRTPLKNPMIPTSPMTAPFRDRQLQPRPPALQLMLCPPQSDPIPSQQQGCPQNRWLSSVSAYSP